MREAINEEVSVDGSIVFGNEIQHATIDIASLCYYNL